MSEEVPTSGDPGTPSAWDDDTWPGVSEGSWAEASGDPGAGTPRPRDRAPSRRGDRRRRGRAGAGQRGGRVPHLPGGDRHPGGGGHHRQRLEPDREPVSRAPLPGRLRGAERLLRRLNLIQDAATAIGVSEQTLQSDLQSGKTVAQVATANGKTAQDVITALVGDETTAIDNLVSSGKLTSSQASKITANLTQMVTDFVNQARPATVPGIGGGAPESRRRSRRRPPPSASPPPPSSPTSPPVRPSPASPGPQRQRRRVVTSAVTTAIDSQISSLESSGKITSAEASTPHLGGAVPGHRVGERDLPRLAVRPLRDVRDRERGSFGGGPFAGMPWGHGPAPRPAPRRRARSS